MSPFGPHRPAVVRTSLAALALLGSTAMALAVDLTVYNAQHESLTGAWAEGITRETGVKVPLRNGEDSELGDWTVQEGGRHEGRQRGAGPVRLDLPLSPVRRSGQDGREQRQTSPCITSAVEIPARS